MNDLLLTYYGDDFTGSTDVMEQLVLGGVPTVLFLDIPTDEQLANFPDVRAVGIAGISRSMTPDEMDAELPPKFRALNALGAPFFHYKVCSTFDSSPTVGSIGHATEIGWHIFDPPFVPLIVGAPFLRRYVAFGNLFARVGEVTYRLDRHPTMSKHPITPMDEADLGLHLGKQTRRRIGRMDLWHMTSKPGAELDDYLGKLVDNGVQIVVFDTLNDDHLAIVGRVVAAQQHEKPVFIVGSSGVEAALTRHWQAAGVVQEPPPLTSPGEVDQLLVMCGSAAPATADQITWAEENGYTLIRLDVLKLIDPEQGESEREKTIAEAKTALERGESVVMFSAHGPDDPTIAKTNAMMIESGLNPRSIGGLLGPQQGRIVKTLLQETGLRRVCVAGGDTSGHAAMQLGIYALQAIQPISPGAPLCRASSETFDGLEISLKGGQNGEPDYFGAIKRGRA